MIKLLSPENNAVIDTHTDLQNTFIDTIYAQGTDKALEWLLPRKNNIERSHPNPLVLEWTNDGSTEYEVFVSETEDFENAKVFKTTSTTYSLVNLKIGQQYFWKVNNSAVGTFSTKNNRFRFVKVDGLLNMRDLGGINIKQGLLYRGSEIHDDELSIEESGKSTFIEDLGIKTQMNLRLEGAPSLPHSYVGEQVAYAFLPYRPYKEVFYDDHRKGLRKIFEFLADESHYPIYFHCFGGADRTGMIALFLRCLLDEPEEDILVDYEITSLSIYAAGVAEGVSSLGFRNRKCDYFVEFLDLLEPYAPGGTLNDKVKNFLLDCEISKETLDKVISNIKK